MSPFSRGFVSCVLACLLSAASAHGARESIAEFLPAQKRATKQFDSKGGYKYMVAFTEALEPAIAKALDACATRAKNDGRCDFVFRVSADGKISRYSTHLSPTAPK